MLKIFLPFVLIFQTLIAKEFYTIGFPQDNMSNSWRSAQVLETKLELSKYNNIKFIYTDAKGNSAKQALDAIKMVESGIDLLIISPRNTKAMTPIISDIYKSGIPVIVLTREIFSTDYTTFISADDEIIAKEAAKELVAAVNNKGKVVILRGIPTTRTAQKRDRGFINEIKKYPNIEIIAHETANYSKPEAIKVIDKLIEKGIEFDAIYAHNDAMASGARFALKMAGKDLKKYKIVSIDYINEVRKAIINGTQHATFVYPTCGKEAARIAIKVLNGKKVPKRITMDSQKITKKNASKIKPIF